MVGHLRTVDLGQGVVVQREYLLERYRIRVWLRSEELVSCNQVKYRICNPLPFFLASELAATQTG
jgi:hypothetical protein